MNDFSEFDEEQQKSVDWGALLFKYLAYWKWFAGSVLICCALAVLYLKLTPKTYEVKTTILLKDDKKGGGTADTDIGVLKDMGLFNVKNNVDNELEVLKTTTLAENVVRELGIYVSYHQIDGFSDRSVSVLETPVKIWLTDEQLNAMTTQLLFEVTLKPNGYTIFSGTFNDNDFAIKARIPEGQVRLPFGTVHFRRSALAVKQDEEIEVTINDPMVVAQGIQESMEMDLTSKTTSVVDIAFNTRNIAMGKAFLTKFIDVYNRQDMEDQNLVAANTDRFVGERLEVLSKELNDVERQVENYKQQHGLTDIDAESQSFIDQTGDLEKKRLEIETQLAIVSDIDLYVHRKENKNKLLPAATGVKNTDITSQIDAYNTLLLRRTRLMRTASADNQAMVDMNRKIDDMYAALQTAVHNEKQSWQIARKDVMEKYGENSARIRAIPRQEREYMEIQRQQTIKSTLYLFLLQKREENSLNMSSVVPKAKIIDKVRSDGVPISPKRNMILLGFVLVGFVIPIIVLRVRDLFRYQLESKSELESLSSIPILAEVSKNQTSEVVAIKNGSIDSFSEKMRLLRSNVLFVLNEKKGNVISVVSSLPKEGKTFISINLAMSLALLEKQVVLVGLDLRKPMLDRYLNIDNATGVSLFLSGHVEIEELVKPSGIHPCLSVITSGPIPPNPNELLAKSALDQLVTSLRGRFDYIIFDTAPVSMVSDSYLLNRVSDITLYVVREGYTPKKCIADTNRLFEAKKFNRLYFVLNYADVTKENYRYGGYAKKYGYGYNYGHENK